MAQEFGVKVIYSGADMSRPAEIREMIRHAASEFDRLDILVNNAGIQYTETVDDFPEEKWDAILAINLSANFHAIKAALPYMKEKNWGRIINTASVHGLVGSANMSAYVAAKHGVIGLTKVVALENASTGITCNAICPGWVLTALVQRQIDDLAAKESICQPRRRHAWCRQSSLPAISPHRSRSRNWPCSSVRTQPRRCAARPLPSMAAGRRNKQVGLELRRMRFR
jgi:3-hydroxybutyrate dehydrogenase